MIHVTQDNRSGWCVVSLSGRADAEAADSVETALRAAVEQHAKVAADFSAVEYISSAGLRAVLQAARAAEARRVDFAVFALSPSVRRVFDMSGLHHVLQIHQELPC